MPRYAYQQTVNAAQTLSGAGGRTIALGNVGWACLAAVRVTLVTTASAGNRQLRMRVLDNANNPLLDVIDANTIPASQTATISFAGLQSLAVGNTHLVPLPPDFAMPLGAQINVADAAAIDNNDTIAVTAVYTI